MIDSQKVLYSEGKNDECITPRYAVEPIVKYIPKDKIVWCPFDLVDSEFVKVFTEKGYRVERSHLAEGKDFFEYEPEKWDVIVSNPPFGRKRKFFERALSFGKPFALIMANTWLNDSAPKLLFEEKDLQLLMFDRRILYADVEGKVNNKITFSSSYFCWDVLPKQIIMERIEI